MDRTNGLQRTTSPVTFCIVSYSFHILCNNKQFKKAVRLQQTDTFKAVWFALSKQTALMWSDNEQERP